MLKNRMRNLMMLAPDDGGSDGGNPAPNGGEPSPKTFTQEDLNRIAAQEKRAGAAAVYRELGFEKPEDAKAAIEAWRKNEEEKKTDLEKAQTELKTAQDAKAAAERKSQNIERKFQVVKEGAPADKADDIVVLAEARMNDSKDFETALKEIKEQFPMLFDNSGESNSSGTGTKANPPRKTHGNGEAGELGKRLAGQKKAAPAKNSYFKK